MSTTEPPPLRRPPRHRIPPWLRIVLTVIAVGAAVWFLVIPQLSDAEASFAAIENLAPPLVVASFLLQVLSLLSNSALTGVVLGRQRLPYRTLLRIDLSDLAVNHTAPGGGTVAGAARFRLFVLEHVPPREAVAAATVQISISNLALAVVFLLGVVLSLAQIHGDPGNYVLAGAVVLALIGGIAAAVWLLLRQTPRVDRFARAVGRRVPFLGEERASRFIDGLVGSVRVLGQDHRRLGWAWVFAGGNWVFDAGSLWVMLAALGQPIALGPLLLVYSVGSILAFLPLTPGGIGIVEGVMVPALTGFGMPHSTALLGVIGWRLFEYWLPIPAGGIAYASLRLARRRRHASGTERSPGARASDRSK